MAISEAPAIADLDAGSVGECLALSDEAGWNQTAADWRLFIERGRTFGARDGEGRLAASAAALPFERDMAYVAMVLVTARARRQGLATRLVDRCVAHIRQAGLVPVLDATPAGEAVYQRQGFHTAFRLERWQGTAAGDPDAPLPAGIRPFAPDDAATVAALDAAAVGAPRPAILADFLARAGSRALLPAERTGFVLVREGRRALQLGPLVAAAPAEALKLLGAALAAVRGAVFLDVPVAQREIGEWLAARGFTRQRSFARMLLDRAEPFGAPGRLHAAAGPEFG